MSSSDWKEEEGAGAAVAVPATNVVVCVRVRCLLPDEVMRAASRCVEVLYGGGTLPAVRMGPKNAFQFDAVFDVDTPQATVYESCVAPLVDGLLSGYNATVLAYGQTGSGKTYTMGTADQVGIPMAKQGLIPRTIRALFDRITDCPSISIRASFVELYREEIRDLLHPETTAKAISIRETPGGGIVLVGVGEKPAHTAQDMFGIVETGCALRTTGATLMNELSSRSHAVFTVIVDQRRPDGRRTVAKLHMVDLAGSERAKRTGAVGTRFKESVNINEGLLALGNVISALAKGGRRGHVPYRDSKLTRLLQDSLGGNSRTVMVACVSPADVSFEETLNTLRYAARARNIKNKPIQNVQAAAAGVEVAALQAEIDALQVALSAQGTAVAASPPPAPRVELDKVEREAARVRSLLDGCRSQLSKLAEDLIGVAAALNDPAPRWRALRERVMALADTCTAAAGGHVAGGGRPATAPAVPDGQGDPATLRAQLARVTRDLQDAKEDLARDEEIFSRKAATIKELQAVVEDSYRENEMLRAAVLAVEQMSLSGGLPVSEGKLGEGDDEAGGGGGDTSGSVADIDFMADLQAVDEERQALEAENKRLVEQQVELEAAAARAAAAADRDTHKLESQLRDYGIGIRLKEELIRTLAHSEAEAAAAAGRYQEQVESLSAAAARLEASAAEAATRLAAEQEAGSAAVASLAQEKEELATQLRRTRRQLAQAKRAQTAAAGIVKQQSSNAARVADLQAQVDRMRSKRASLEKQAAAAANAAAAASKASAAEIALLEKQIAAQKAAMGQLEARNRVQSAALQAKRGEAARRRAAGRPTTAPSGGRRAPGGARRWRDLQALVAKCVSARGVDARVDRARARKEQLNETMGRLRGKAERLRAAAGRDPDAEQQLADAEEGLEAAEAEAEYVEAVVRKFPGDRGERAVLMAQLAAAVGRVPLGDAHNLLRVCCEALVRAGEATAASAAKAAAAASNLHQANAHIASLEAAIHRTTNDFERRLALQGGSPARPPPSPGRPQDALELTSVRDSLLRRLHDTSVGSLAGMEPMLVPRAHLVELGKDEVAARVSGGALPTV